MRAHALAVAVALTIGAAGPAAAAEKKYDQGASDTEIKLGQTMPYSGPASYVGMVGRTQLAYFRMINEKGGINGRKVELISLDDAYNPAKTVEATRRLVEGDGILATMSSNGTVTQAAVQKYLNSKGIPQLLIGSGSSRWNEPKTFPWSTGALSLYLTEGRIFGRWLLANKPDAKLGILSQNDDLGRDFLRGIKEGLGDKAATMIVAEQTYDLTEPTVDSQIVTLSKSGANVFFNITTGKFVTQSVRKVKELNWPVLHYLMSASATYSLLAAAGLENAKGLMTVQTVKRLASPEWNNDPEVKTYEAFRAKYAADIPAQEEVGFYAYSSAVIMHRILEACGDDLTRANILKHATNLKGQTSPILLPGITLNTSPSDYEPVTVFYMGVFNGTGWEISKDPIR
ncbi:ABC transporter substrate-binding protein [Chelatococcus reniformis]|uniref:Branched-chain amino acid ABC transporter substrate-binding protein n=1 Tax=Chelatococcus reniformis TaxID=1494448 RepID=A0A916U1Q0_9HYPH|nr:ABC transporter substrate-binding protein [Chelatococcus reniformis]GGC54865.1 branched-chain amino acid ABC transporter substrate-binding protein [Chelatococcus reniformis]